jgi:hypothetical protein
MGPSRSSEKAVGVRLLDLGALLLKPEIRRGGRRKRGKGTALALLLPLLICARALVGSETRPAAEQAKIDRLLQRVRDSDAVFLRNGKEYGGKQAAAHLQTKLLLAGSRVQTARDFVRSVATRSERSGEPYRIRLSAGGSFALRDWLLERLVELEHPPREPVPTPLEER